jgi:AraC family transcriptional regulator
MPRPAISTRQQQLVERLFGISCDSVCESGAYRRDAIDDAASQVRLNDQGGAVALSLDHAVVEDRMAFQHLHLVLVAAAQGANGFEVVQPSAATERLDDPVIRHLSDALAATDQSRDRHAVIHADALRLAIAVRLFGLKSEAQRSPEHSHLVSERSAERPIRALQKWRLRRVVEYVDNHLSEKITLLDLAAVAGLSCMHFASQFRVATGFRPHEYVLRQRIRRADELLRHSTMAIVEIALAVGFQTQAHFTTVFKRIVGSTPYKWRHACYAALQHEREPSPV